MNFLAHCLIAAEVESDAADDVGLIAGGFLGDFVKGSLPQDMPAALALGIRLHRRVDAYCNTHPVVRTSCARFPEDVRRFAPIFVDILGDHLLARGWHAHHSAPLPAFTDRAYGAIDAHRTWLSADGQRFLDYARDADLLARYADWPVIARTLVSVTRRIRRPALTERVVAVSRELIEPLAEDFAAYFPDVVGHAASWIREGAAAGDARSDDRRSRGDAMSSACPKHS